MKKELACWMLNKAEGTTLFVHFTDIFKNRHFGAELELANSDVM